MIKINYKYEKSKKYNKIETVSVSLIDVVSMRDRQVREVAAVTLITWLESQMQRLF